MFDMSGVSGDSYNHLVNWLADARPLGSAFRADGRVFFLDQPPATLLSYQSEQGLGANGILASFLHLQKQMFLKLESITTKHNLFMCCRGKEPNESFWSGNWILKSFKPSQGWRAGWKGSFGSGSTRISFQPKAKETVSTHRAVLIVQPIQSDNHVSRTFTGE